MTKKLLIVGDPTGLISLRAITSKGFLPENITVWENDDRHIFSIKQIHDKIKIIKCEDTEYYNKVTSSSMRFTSSLANPPYLKNLHLEFLKANLLTSDYVRQTHPSGWLYRTSKKIEREVKNLLKDRVKKLTIYNGNTTFTGTQFQAPLVITEADKFHNEKIEVHYKTSGNTYFLDSLDEFPTGFWEPKQEHLDLIEKIKNRKDNKLTKYVSTYSGQKYFLKCPRISGDGRSKDSSKMCKNDFWTFFYDNSDLFSGIDGAKCLILSSEEEVKSIHTFLRTKFARFCLSISKITVDLYIKRYLENVLIPPLDRKWDDESVYEYFDINEQEQEYINNFIPNFYA
jgi:hypothetical protein